MTVMTNRCLVMVERLFLAVQRGCLQFVIVVFPDHTHLLFFMPPKGCTSSRSSKWKHAVGKNTYNDRAKRPPAFLKS